MRHFPILVAALLGACAQQTEAPAVPPLRAAVAARDMDALLPTLTAGESLVMIAPNGHKFDTRQQYIDFHQQWFAGNDGGKLEPEILRLIESPTLGHAFIRYRYSFKDASGKGQSMENWLALTFALENGNWRLVFDQNTPVEPK